MKKLILSLLVIAAFASTSLAQINLKVGVNLANQSFETGGLSIEPGSKIGFLIGANYKSNLSNSLAIRPGIQFTLKGSKFDFGSDEFKNNFNYLEVPVDLVYTSGSLSVHAGPYLGLLMSANADGEDVKDEVKSTDFGLNLGLGYSFGQFGLGVNYGLGLSNISDDAEGSVKNKVLSFYVTYAL